jgi:dihydrofolate synthase/folylpolyglutamate synthase
MSTDGYQAAIDYLYSYADYSVGNPHHQFKSFHVAGTKGKGSVSALIASVLQAAGYKTGLYTSPHLIRFNERIRVGANDIPDEDLVSTLERMKPHIEAIPDLTVYEIATVLAFCYFADVGVEYAAIEVGLGGRLDATNVLEPMIAVITSLSYDHMHLLGDTLSDIAREKAGIIKTGIPIVLAPPQYVRSITLCLARK